MKKYQELIVTALMNISVAFIAGGALKFLLDDGHRTQAWVTTSSGVLALVAFGLLAYLLDKEK